VNHQQVAAIQFHRDHLDRLAVVNSIRTYGFWQTELVSSDETRNAGVAASARDYVIPEPGTYRASWSRAAMITSGYKVSS
jgi:hypothetical protein